MRPRKVAFIAHPLSLSTLSILSGVPEAFLKLIGKQKIKKFLEWKKPFIFERINSIKSAAGPSVDLIGVACPLLPEQMAMLPEEKVLAKIIEAVEFAQQAGAELCVLGGFTSVVGNEGEEVSKRVKIPVTSGNTYTSALAVEGVLAASRMLGRNLSTSRLAVIGATGDIGGAVTHYLAKFVQSVAISARNEKKLSDFQKKLTNNFNVQVDVYRKTSEAVLDADIIISATSALTTLIEPEDLKPGAIVCDVALPANIAREVWRKRKDVLVFEGGLSSVPSYDKIKSKVWNHLMPTNAIYGCLAEGLVLGLEEVFENFSIGRGNITDEKIDFIMRLARSHGFNLSSFFCGEKFYQREDFEQIRGFIQNQKENQKAREFLSHVTGTHQ